LASPNFVYRSEFRLELQDRIAAAGGTFEKAGIDPISTSRPKLVMDSVQVSFF
jgi:hypothetical protein